MPHSPQHCQTDKRVEAITGINESYTTLLRFLSQELYGSQCPQGPLSLYISLLSTLHLHHQRLLQVCSHLLLHCTCINYYPLSCLLFFLRLIDRFFFSPNPCGPLPSPLPHSVGCSLYVILKARAQLEVKSNLSAQLPPVPARLRCQKYLIKSM